MSLPESEEALSAIKQLQKKMKTEHGIFEEANKDLKVLQRDIREKQTALEDLRENLQEQDKDASELLGKLWKQQEKIKGHLAAQSADEIKKAVQEQTEFINLEQGRIEQESENIESNIRLCQELDWFLHEDGKNIDNIDIERRKEFSQLLEKNDKEELLEKNSQLMAELNASMQNLEKRDKNLIEQKKELQKKDLAGNLTVDAQPILQGLFKERQAEITKEIDVILAKNPIIEEQYKNVKLQEEKIKTIQDQIEQKTQIIEQSKQKEEQLFEELKQLEQKSYPPLSSAKQQQEDSISQYPILQERANDVEVSLKRQIKLNKLNKQLEIAESKIDDQDHQLQQLKLSADKERLSANVQIQKNLERVSELQERIRELEREKKEQQIGQQQFITPNDPSLLDELEKALKTDKFVKLEARISELTQENNDLKTKLKEVEKSAKEQLEVLSGEKELENDNLKQAYEKQLEYLKDQSVQDAAKLQELGEELSPLRLEQQKTRSELVEKQQLLEKSQKDLLLEQEKSKNTSKRVEDLETQLNELTTVQGENNNLQAQLQVEKNEKKQLVELSGAKDLEYSKAKEDYTTKLREVGEELSKLKSEQQAKQAELQKTKEELTNTREELHGQESKQAKELQDQLDGLTKAQRQLTTELEKTREAKESQIKALTEAKEAANLDLQAAEEKYAAMLKGQSEAAAAELQTINEKLSQLKSEQQEKQAELERTKEELTGTSEKLLKAEELHGKESEQAKKLQAEVKELTKVQHQLTTELKETREGAESRIAGLTKEKESATLGLQVARLAYEAMLKEQSEAAAAELQTINEKLSQLKLEQQEKQAELERTKEELTGTSEKLLKAEELHGKESEQAKKLQAEVKELTKVQHQLTTELKETREGAESRIAGLTKEKESATLGLQVARLAYEAMLKEQSEAAAAELQTINEKLSQLKLEQQEKQAELERTKEELTGTSEKLLKAEELHGKESKQAKELQDQVEELTKVQHKLTTELKETREGAESRIAGLTKEKESATLGLQVARLAYEAMLKEQSEAAAAELQTINEKLSQLKLEQQEKQAELERTKEELTGTSEKLLKAEELHGKESKQAKELQDQVEELTKVQHKLTTELKETREGAESRIAGLTKEKESATLGLQVARLAYEAMLKEQSEAAAAELQTINEKLSQLKSEQQESRSELEKKQQELIIVQESLKAAEQEYGVESKQAKELQAQLGGLTNENNSLKTQLEEIENERKQLEVLSGKKDLEYNYLEAEYEKQQAELKKIQQELTEAQEELTLEKAISDEQYDQNKNFKTQLNKVTDENAGLKSQLEKIKEDTKNQLETLSARKDLEYNALKEEQKRSMDELYGRLKDAEKHNQIMQGVEQAGIKDIQDKNAKIAALERQNAALLEQLEKLQIKAEVQGASVQTDKIVSQSIGTETETITKEFRAVDSQTDNRQKLHQSVGTEYRSVMDSGVSVDKVLVQDKTKGSVYDDDKILQAFKELSREQVQPIVNKFSLESTSSFAQFAQKNVGGLSEVLRDSEVLREIENIEQRGYTDIHKKFAAEYKDIEWQDKGADKSFSLQQNGKDVVTINETTLSYDVSHDDKNAKYKTSEGEEIKNARMVNIPLSIDMQGACHMSFAVQDTNGRNISKEDAVYLTAHYKNGKLVHLTKPTEIFSCSEDNKSPLYLKRKGKTYTLPVDKSTLEKLEQEVLKNKGEYVGIVKNAQGNIRVNSAAVPGLQPDRVIADPLFKDASQLLHDANATPALDGSLDKKGPAHKKPNRNVGGSRNF